MTAQLRRKSFLGNKRGYSGIVATIFMVLVVLFLIFNVQLYMLNRDAALQDTIGQSQQLEADANTEQLMFISQSATASGNQATVTWQMKNTSPISIELVNLWVQSTPTAYGNTPVSIALSPGETDSSAKTVTLSEAASGSCIFWFVTSRGNVLGPTLGTQGPAGQDGRDGQTGSQGPSGPQGPEGESGLVSSIKMDWLKFRYYDFGTTAPTDGTPLPQAHAGCDIPQDHYVMICAEFTNMDPEGRTITLTSDTYAWAVNPRDNTGNGALKTLLAWPIVTVQNGQIHTSFTTQDLYVNVPTYVYFFDWENPTPYSTETPVPLSINLYGTTLTGSYGQNIPFVSIKFFPTNYPVHFIDSANRLHDTTNPGTHSSFTAMQAGPDLSYDTLTETSATAWTRPAAIPPFYGDGRPWVPGQDPGHEAAYTIDGDTSTYWSYSQNTEHYICFDLGQNYTVNQISLYQDSTASRRFGYRGSIDVYIWYFDNGDIFEHQVATWTGAGGSSGWVNLTLPSPADGRYIKLWEHDADYESQQRLYEFRFQYIQYDLGLEGQFRNVAHYQRYTELQVQTRSFTAAENLAVYYWNNGWVLLGNLNPNTLNTFTVALSSNSFDIKFVGTQLQNDRQQSTWQIDYCALVAP